MKLLLRVFFNGYLIPLDTPGKIRIKALTVAVLTLKIGQYETTFVLHDHIWCFLEMTVVSAPSWQVFHSVLESSEPDSNSVSDVRNIHFFAVLGRLSDLYEGTRRTGCGSDLQTIPSAETVVCNIDCLSAAGVSPEPDLTWMDLNWHCFCCKRGVIKSGSFIYLFFSRLSLCQFQNPLKTTPQRSR